MAYRFRDMKFFKLKIFSHGEIEILLP